MADGARGGGIQLDVERRLEELCATGDVSAATTLALRRYGPELLGFLVHALGDPDLGAEAFSALAEDVWRGLPGFRWESSFRTWAYRLARNAASRARDRRRHEERRAVPLSAVEGLSEIVAAVRTDTLTFLRTEARSDLARLRAELTDEERMLLVLRIDRELSWPDLVAVLDEPGEPARAAARVRKRFQLLKERIVRRARELGLVPVLPEAS